MEVHVQDEFVVFSARHADKLQDGQKEIGTIMWQVIENHKLYTQSFEQMKIFEAIN